jgi:16S rRNA processing protein RimM
MNKAADSYIAVGKIIGVHGTQGMIKVAVYSQMMNRFEGVDTIFFQTPKGMEGKILSAADTRTKAVILKLKDVNSREAAQELKGREIFLPMNQQVRLPEDTYFLHDLVGMDVRDQQGNFLGELQEVLLMGGNDVYVVRRGKEELLIPAVSEFVKDVSLERKELVVRLWDEM